MLSKYRIPLATKHKKFFTIEGRKGNYKLIHGNRKPGPGSGQGRWRTIAYYYTTKGRKYVREFMEIRVHQKGDDQLVLDRILEQTIKVDFNTGDIFTCLGASGKKIDWRKLAISKGRRGDHFVSICRHGKRKAIAVSKVIIMADTKKLIPPGFDVDHINRNYTDNALDNLRLRNSSENRADNQPWDDDLPF